MLPATTSRQMMKMRAGMAGVLMTMIIVRARQESMRCEYASVVYIFFELLADAQILFPPKTMAPPNARVSNRVPHTEYLFCIKQKREDHL